MKYVIRPMVIADYDALHALWLSTPGMGLNNLDDSREGIACFIARNPRTCFIAEQDGQSPSVVPDGIYGPNTTAAVTAFQRRHGLPVTVYDRHSRGANAYRAMAQEVIKKL